MNNQYLKEGNQSVHSTAAIWKRLQSLFQIYYCDRAQWRNTKEHSTHWQRRTLAVVHLCTIQSHITHHLLQLIYFSILLRNYSSTFHIFLNMLLTKMKCWRFILIPPLKRWLFLREFSAQYPSSHKTSLDHWVSFESFPAVIKWYNTQAIKLEID